MTVLHLSLYQDAPPPFHFFFFFWPRCTACRILVPRPGIEPTPPAVEVRSLNHWTAREFPPLLHYVSTWRSFHSGCLACVQGWTYEPPRPARPSLLEPTGTRTESHWAYIVPVAQERPLKGSCYQGPWIFLGSSSALQRRAVPWSRPAPSHTLLSLNLARTGFFCLSPKSPD